MTQSFDALKRHLADEIFLLQSDRERVVTDVMTLSILKVRPQFGGSFSLNFNPLFKMKDEHFALQL